MTFPTGTVTFLFTDIQGSTKLWEAHPEAMRLALARHDSLLRAAIETNGGTVFKTIGDAFCAAFHSAPEAVTAALSAQRGLNQINAGEGSHLPLKVRMALYTGTAEQRDSDYFGQPLNRAARLLATGHGGQVLLSHATVELVRDHLPENTSVTDLGEHRLKDLQRQEQVHQLLHPNLQADFPPLKSLDNPDYHNNLPVQLTSFIGREKEMSDVKELLGKARLLTLSGSGGSGKTRLSLQVAGDVLEQYPDGVWFVELAPISDPSMVPQAVAQILNIREAPGEPITKTLLSSLKNKQTLLILDNCEHVLEASAILVVSVLKSCPKLSLLVTSREAMAIAGESIYLVPSLSLPETNTTHAPETLSQFEAVRLFIERAGTVKPDFTVTKQNASVLASVCLRLDGIPLAIELAAARVRSLPVEEINSRLDQRFHLLKSGSRTALERHQTLRALVDWSYNLLSTQEKTLLNRVSVFAGGWDLESTEKVCSGEGIDELEVLDLLTALVDKSLVVYVEQNGQARYRLLETIRQYGREKIQESGETEQSRRRHRDWFLSQGEADANSKWFGVGQEAWLSKLDIEHDNVRVAMEWCLEEVDGAEIGLRFAKALAPFWWPRGYLSEGQKYLTAALSRDDAQPPSTARADAVNALAFMEWLYGGHCSTFRSLQEQSLAIYRQMGDRRGIAASMTYIGTATLCSGNLSGAHSLITESLSICHELDDRQGIAQAISELGVTMSYQGEYNEARALLEESLVMCRELGNKWYCANNLVWLGLIEKGHGDFRTARSNFEQALTLLHELGDRRTIAYFQVFLGEVLTCQGNFEHARYLQEDSLAIHRECGSQHGIAMALCSLGALYSKQGDYDRSVDHLCESLILLHRMELKLMIPPVLEELGAVATRLRQHTRAAHLFGAANGLRACLGVPLPPLGRAEVEQNLAELRAALGEDAFHSAFTIGGEMTLEQVIAFSQEPNA